jgi:hypothetical protein
MANEFECGDVVVDIATGKAGTVVDSFPWRDCTDGYAYPSETPIGWLPIDWDDGTSGYRPASVLEYSYL